MGNGPQPLQFVEGSYPVMARILKPIYSTVRIAMIIGIPKKVTGLTMPGSLISSPKLQQPMSRNRVPFHVGTLPRQHNMRLAVL